MTNGEEGVVVRTAVGGIVGNGVGVGVSFEPHALRARARIKSRSKPARGLNEIGCVEIRTGYNSKSQDSLGLYVKKTSEAYETSEVFRFVSRLFIRQFNCRMNKIKLLRGDGDLARAGRVGLGQAQGQDAVSDAGLGLVRVDGGGQLQGALE